MSVGKVSVRKNVFGQSVFRKMSGHLCPRHGIPDEVVADNMPFSSKEYLQFAQEWGFKIPTSSPH
jgi:hypothetical protein